MSIIPVRHHGLVLFGSAALISIGLVFAASAQNAPSAAPSPTKQAVESRKAIYALIGNYFRPFGAVVKGNAAYDEAEVAKRAARIVFLSGLVSENFPEGSNVGEPESKAKADVWSNRADFDKKLKEFQAHAEAFVETNAKEKGATDAWKAAVASLAQDCKRCHETYKVK
jgi:cytochrome c556